MESIITTAIGEQILQQAPLYDNLFWILGVVAVVLLVIALVTRKLIKLFVILIILALVGSGYGWFRYQDLTKNLTADCLKSVQAGNLDNCK